MIFGFGLTSIRLVENVTLFAAFGAGLVSFLSPCVLPLVPVYLASLCGQSVLEPAANRKRAVILLHSLGFVAGFSASFAALGAIAGLTGFAIDPDRVVLNWISGGLLLFFGLFMLAAIKLPQLNFEKRLTVNFGSTTGYVRSFSIGAIFALAWTACVGPVLGSILSLALSSATAAQGAYLLAIYSLGLGIPFVAAGLALDSVLPLLKAVQRYSGATYAISGLLLIAIGILTMLGKLAWFSSLAG